MNEIIKGMGFHHIALEANNLEETLKFYKALGMKKYRAGHQPTKVSFGSFGMGTGRVSAFPFS